MVMFVWWYVYSGIGYLPPHFHANFAMYVNGERIDLSGDEYMEDVAGCSISWWLAPEDRVHLHENNQDTIHIHHEWVSWGHFFGNIGFTFGENYLALDSWEVLQNNEDLAVRYILNGKLQKNPFNKAISSKDRLLVAYGSENMWELLELYENVSDNAWEYNDKYDPGSCGGTNENAVKALLTDFIHSFHNMEH